MKKIKGFFFLGFFSIAFCVLPVMVSNAKEIIYEGGAKVCTITLTPEISYNENSIAITVIVTTKEPPIQSVANQGVQITIIKGQENITVAPSYSLQTNSDGKVTVFLTAKKTGEYEVRVDVIGITTVNLKATFYYIPGSPTGIPCRGTQRTFEGVNTLNGNLCFTVRDFQISGRDPNIEFFRTYNSQSDYIGILGKGWVCNYDMRILNPNAGDTIYFMDEYGGIKEFSRKGLIYEPPPGVYLKLTQSQGYWVVTNKFGTKYYFDNGAHTSSFCRGRLLKIIDRNNNVLNLEWQEGFTGSPPIPSYIYLSSVSNNYGQHIHFTYYVYNMYNFIPELGYSVDYYIAVIAGIYGFPDESTYHQYKYEKLGPGATSYAAPYLLNTYIVVSGHPENKYYDTAYQYDNGREICRLVYADDPRRGPGSSKLYYKYDDFGRVTEVQNADQIPITKFEYRFFDSYLDGQLIKLPETRITEKFSATQSYTTIDRYNEKGFHFQIELPNGHMMISAWDEEKLNRLTSIDLNNIYTDYSYDETGNIIYEHSLEYFSSGGPEKTTRREFKGPFNGITKLINPRSKITTWQYDDFGNARFVYELMGKTTQNIFDYTSGYTGDLIETIDPNGNHTKYGYDQWGNFNKITIINPQGDNIVTEYVNNSIGRRIQKTDPLGRITTQTWNAIDKITNITFYDGTQINRTYNARGRLTQEIDSSGHITTYGYDNKTDRLVSIIKYREYNNSGSSITGSEIITTYDYDYKGNLKDIKKYKGNINSVLLQNIKYEYDWLNRVILKIEPGQQAGVTRTTRYGYGWGFNSPYEIIYNNEDGILNIYDCFGWLKTFQDRKGDGLEKEEFRYDANNNMIYAAGSYGMIYYTYDDLDRLINTNIYYKNCLPVNFNYVYDYNGNRVSMSKYIGTLGQQQSGINYIYDFANRLINATHSFFGTIDYTYDKVGNRTTMTYPNKVAQITYDYDVKNRISNQTYKNKHGVVLSSVDYTYYNNGDRKTMINEFGITNYKYDGLDQITKVQTPRWGTQEYIYDDLGNRSQLKITEQGIERDVFYTYDPANELRTIDDSGTITLDYDKRGNCTRKGNIAYEWDCLDQLVKVTNGSKVSEFTYDHQRRRIKKIDSNGTRYYFYDGLDLVLELDVIGNIISEQFNINNELISKKFHLSISNFQQIIYHLNDHLGSAVFILDSAGNLLANHYYGPFGKAWNVKGDIGNSIRFTGKEYEEDIGLYYFATRWYNPDIGRFISPDPLEPLGYNYCKNNPINYIDILAKI